MNLQLADGTRRTHGKKFMNVLRLGRCPTKPVSGSAVQERAGKRRLVSCRGLRFRSRFIPSPRRRLTATRVP